jgi:hypothetical protein
MWAAAGRCAVRRNINEREEALVLVLTMAYYMGSSDVTRQTGNAGSDSMKSSWINKKCQAKHVLKDTE